MNVRDKDLFWWSFPFLIPHKLTTASDFQVVYQALNCGSWHVAKNWNIQKHFMKIQQIAKSQLHT